MIINRDGDKPCLIMMIGIAGSGKSTLSNQIQIAHNGEIVKPTIHSSDAIRKELYGDENIEGDKEQIFKLLHCRIKQDLANGVDVVYDATNLNNRKRAGFLRELKHINCQKEAVCVLTPWGVCCRQNK